MDSLLWLFAANAVIWIGIGCYAAFLGNRQSGLAKRLKQLEFMGNGGNK